MKLTHSAVLVAAVALAAAIAVQGPTSAGAQDKAGAGARTGVLNLRDCMDKTRNAWIAEIELELQKAQEAESGRATDLNPQERARIRTKIMDLSNKRKLEVYNEIVRISGAVAKERGFELVQRVDRMPVVESGDSDLAAQIDRRVIVHFDPSIDISSEVLERINKDHFPKKK
jgi:Skp family chaperone for outer membrane proteins